MQDRRERWRIHRDYIWYMAFQWMATLENLKNYANTIPCEECQWHFKEALGKQQDLEWSSNQMQFLYSVYESIQNRKWADILTYENRISFFMERLLLSN